MQQTPMNIYSYQINPQSGSRYISIHIHSVYNMYMYTCMCLCIIYARAHECMRANAYISVHEHGTEHIQDIGPATIISRNLASITIMIKCNYVVSRKDREAVVGCDLQFQLSPAAKC